MTHGYVLRIGWSRSINYSAAQTLALAVPDARLEGAETEAVIGVPLATAPPATIVRLLHWVRDWRGTALELDGVPLSRLALYHLATTMECAAARALGGAGALQCWGLPEGQRRRLPCRFLDTILPYQPDGTPAAAWTTAIHATARLQAVAACPAYNPAAVAEAVDRWTQGVESSDRANAWQRWQEDRTPARLLGERAWPVDAAATTLPGGPLVVEGRDPGVHDDRDPGVTDDRNDAEQSVASDDDECVDDDGAVDRACARRARTCPGPRARSEGGGGGVASAPRDQPSARAVPSGSDHRGGGWSPLRRAQTYYVT